MITIGSHSCIAVDKPLPSFLGLELLLSSNILSVQYCNTIPTSAITNPSGNKGANTKAIIKLTKMFG